MHRYTELDKTVQLTECKTTDFILPSLCPPNSVELQNMGIDARDGVQKQDSKYW